MAIRILLLAIPTLLMTSAAMAVPSDEAVLDGKTALRDDELADMRGGFLTAGGAQFDFGASIRTMVNGQVALQTSLQWTDAGAVTQQLAGLGQSIRSQVNNVVASNLAQNGIKSGIASPVAPSEAPSEATSNAGTSIAQEVSAAASAAPAAAVVPAAQPAAAAADSAPPTAPAAAVTGVEVPGLGGTTQVFANLSPTQIQSIILNSASGQNITQNTDVTFTIYNFQAWQQQLAQHMVAARLASDMLAASGFAAGH